MATLLSPNSACAVGVILRRLKAFKSFLLALGVSPCPPGASYRFVLPNCTPAQKAWSCRMSPICPPELSSPCSCFLPTCPPDLSFRFVLVVCPPLPVLLRPPVLPSRFLLPICAPDLRSRFVLPMSPRCPPDLASRFAIRICPPKLDLLI